MNAAYCTRNEWFVNSCGCACFRPTLLLSSWLFGSHYIVHHRQSEPRYNGRQKRHPFYFMGNFEAQSVKARNMFYCRCTLNACQCASCRSALFRTVQDSLVVFECWGYIVLSVGTKFHQNETCSDVMGGILLDFPSDGSAFPILTPELRFISNFHISNPVFITFVL